MRLENDRQLLEGYRRGDRAVLDALYRYHSPSVLRALSRGFRVSARGVVALAQVSPLDLDAAHQETFVRAFGESARLHYDGLKPFEPYLLAIARASAVEVLRAQGKMHAQSIALDDVPDQTAALTDPSDSPEELALRAEADASVRAFLSTLGEADLRFATARFIDGLSQQEAGARVGISRQAARTVESRLKAACLAHLSQRGFFEAAGPAARSMLTALVVEFLFRGWTP